MWRIIIWFLMAAGLAWGITWVASQPGTITVEWLGWRVEDMPVALALGLLLLGLLLLWILLRLVRWLIGAPFAAVDFLRGRRRRKAREAVDASVTQLLAGNTVAARQAAGKAARLAPADSLARLLQAQTALAAGELRAARFHYEALKDDPQTEPAALHGLYELALREGDMATARLVAERAMRRYPDLPWAGQALLRAAALAGDWPAARQLLEQLRRHGHIDRQAERRQQAALLAAEALQLEDSAPDKALALALKAHKLDASLTPAALVAGRILGARGKLRKAAKVLEQAWKQAPHPDIAEVYAHLRSGDSPRDRLARVRQLLKKGSGGEEGAVALARAAIDAREWDVALGALRPWLNENPSARIFLLMAELEEARSGDVGRMREWLHRARRARPDPAWVAGSAVSPVWLPVTPEGEIGAFRWSEPPQGARLSAGEPVPEELLQPPVAVDVTAAATAGAGAATGAGALLAAAAAGADTVASDAVASDAVVEPGETARPVQAQVRSADAEDASDAADAGTEAAVVRDHGKDAATNDAAPVRAAEADARQRLEVSAEAVVPDTDASRGAGGDSGQEAAEADDGARAGVAGAEAGAEKPAVASVMAAPPPPRGAEAVAELPEEEVTRPPLPDDPGPPRARGKG